MNESIFITDFLEIVKSLERNKSTQKNITMWARKLHNLKNRINKERKTIEMEMTND